MATRSLSQFKRTISVMGCSEKHVGKNQTVVPSRYQNESRHGANPNGLSSERSSNYNVIKKKRLLREGRSESRNKYFNPQRATIATDHVQYGSLESPAIGHCISHLESILVLLRQQKPQQSTTQRKTQSRTYRTISHQVQNNESGANMCPPEDIVLKFNKNQHGFEERESSQKKMLLSKIISDSKRDSKTIRLKEVRDRYKCLSKSKSIEEYDNVTSVKKINTGRDHPGDCNKRYGRKLIRVCSIANYQVSAQLQSRHRGSLGDVGASAKGTAQHDLKTVKKHQRNTQKQTDIIVEQPKSSTESVKQCNMEVKINQIQPVPLGGIDINCSRIDPKQAGPKSSNSFFSQAPSYLKQENQKVTDPFSGESVNCNRVRNKPQGVLQYLAMDTQQIKNVFKSKQRRRQLDKWKRNFPDGFFEEPAI